MDVKGRIQEEVSAIVRDIYGVDSLQLEIRENKSPFEGDFTLVIFPLVKRLNKSPDLIGSELGERIIHQVDSVASYHVVKGFLNLSMKASFFIQQLNALSKDQWTFPKRNETLMVEYSSPNTNKPLHLGHVRNNLLGFSLAKILEKFGYDVIKTQIINDRGVHICKSMLAFQKFGDGQTPESSGIKGDKFVGNYYVKFDQEYKRELEHLQSQGMDQEEAKEKAPIMQEVRQMLVDWEKGDESVLSLWKTMNGWVYEGFAQTYQRLGVGFDQVQYESDTYLSGKDLVQNALDSGVFYRKEDGSVWCDLSEEGLDQKLLLRSDGTSVYITQDLGTAVGRFDENRIKRLVYVVGNEQDYHFEVLFSILRKMAYPWARHLHHLSYGMIELPDGKMKSREGKVVDADDLMQEMYLSARQKAQELGKLEGLGEDEKENLYETIGLGALKYFILKVDPKKKMLFNPEESIDFNGNTAPFIQYTYARIRSLLARASFQKRDLAVGFELNAQERELLVFSSLFREVITRSAESLSPSHLANYIYDLVKLYNSFYQNHPILREENREVLQFRLQLSSLVSSIIKEGLSLLGIGVVDRM